MRAACITCQALVVFFLAFHDWVPLGRLSNPEGIRRSDPQANLLRSTILSTIPFAVALWGTFEAHTHQLQWAKPYALIAYALMLFGILRAWWLPYLISPEPKRAERYRIRFKETHAFLPERHGIRPDTLHVCFHLLAVLTFLLIIVTPF